MYLKPDLPPHVELTARHGGCEKKTTSTAVSPGSAARSSKEQTSAQGLKFMQTAVSIVVFQRTLLLQTLHVVTAGTAESRSSARPGKGEARAKSCVVKRRPPEPRSASD